MVNHFIYLVIYLKYIKYPSTLPWSSAFITLGTVHCTDKELVLNIYKTFTNKIFQTFTFANVLKPKKSDMKILKKYSIFRESSFIQIVLHLYIKSQIISANVLQTNEFQRELNKVKYLKSLITLRTVSVFLNDSPVSRQRQ